MKSLAILLLLATTALGQNCSICDGPAEKEVSWDAIYYYPRQAEIIDTGLLYKPFNPIFPRQKESDKFSHEYSFGSFKLILCDSCDSKYSEEIIAELDRYHNGLLEDYQWKERGKRKEWAKKRLKDARADTLAKIAEAEKQLRILKGKPIPSDTATPKPWYMCDSLTIKTKIIYEESK